MLSGGAQIVAGYEAALAARFSATHAIAVNSGTSAPRPTPGWATSPAANTA